MIHPSQVSNLDRVNGDIKVGDLVKITRWHAELAFVQVTQVGAAAVIQNTDDANSEGARPNQNLRGDVIEIVAIDYPDAAVWVHTTINGRYTMLGSQLNLMKVELRHTTREYLEGLQMFTDEIAKNNGQRLFVSECGPGSSPLRLVGLPPISTPSNTSLETGFKVVTAVLALGVLIGFAFGILSTK